MARKEHHSNNWGGAREGAGRPTKGELLKVRELLDETIEPDLVTQKLRELIENGDYRAIDLYMKYRVGTPTQSIDVHTTGSQDLNFSLNNLITFKDDSDGETEQGED
jgi:hypothetical protein